MIRQLQVNNLTAERNERCLFSGLSFTLQAGEVLQVMGANGAGKTTLLRMVSGLLPVVDGEVTWQGKRIDREPEAYFSELIYIGHQMGVKGGLTPHENLQFAAQLAGLSLPEHARGDAMQQALDLVGLQGLAHTETHALSMGQQRRVGLARLALLPGRLWILDEPLAALDTAGIAIVERLIVQHLDQTGMVLMTSHQQLHLDGMSPRLLVLDA
jgi:heme exporter protein A